ncbi:MAG: fused response regulator/phosphatase [Leptospiraceae bacterium]|nr:fused response regulator/phosphatase [Leptospiraceae bacterium]
MQPEVLIIDDLQEVCMSIQTILKHTGILSKYFTNPEEGLMYFKQEKNPIVFLDVKLPGRSGIEILKEMKSISPHSQIIMITAIRDIEPVIHSLQYRANDFLLKPFSVETVRIAVDRALEYYKLQREKEAYRQAIETDLRFTAKIQRKFVSPELEQENKLFHIHSTSEVSTDFYHFFPLDDDKELLFFGDIEGKGISCGFLALITIQFIQCSVNKDIDSNQILYELNNQFIYEFGSHTLLASCIVVDKNKKTLTFSPGGMPSPILYSVETFKIINPIENQVIGTLPNLQFEQQTYLYKPGDCLFLYSNGFCESPDFPKDSQFHTLIKSLGQHFSSKKELKNTKTIMEEYINNLLEENLIFDDLSYLFWQLE